MHEAPGEWSIQASGNGSVRLTFESGLPAARDTAQISQVRLDASTDQVENELEDRLRRRRPTP